MQMKKYALILIAMVLRLAAGTAQALTTTYTGPNSSNSDQWNIPANWDNGVPCGTTNVVIPASKYACVWSSTTPTHTGSLVISNSATVGIGWTTVYLQSYNALGTPGATTITMYGGSFINMRMGGTPSIPAIQLAGNASLCMGSSTQPSASPTFGYGINGPYTFTLSGKGGCNAYFTTNNSFGELTTAWDNYAGGGFTIYANAAGSLDGNVTIKTNGSSAACALLVINAANAMSDSGLLRLNGNTGTKLTMNANDTIYSLFMNGTQQVRGVYTSSGMGSGWMTGTGSLTVSTGAPTQPTGLKAVPGTVARSVRLDWAAVTDATGYNIKRSLTNSGYVTVGTASGTNYTDFTVQFMANYYYVVSATNNYVESADSSYVSIILPVPGLVITVR